jgi:hypothetical protein
MVKYTKRLDTVTACSKVNKNFIKQLYSLHLYDGLQAAGKAVGM